MITFTTPSTIEVLGAVLGLIGSVRMLQGKVGSGFLWFLLSNWCWIVFSIQHGHGFLLIQQIGFMAVSAYGCWIHTLNRGGRAA